MRTIVVEGQIFSFVPDDERDGFRVIHEEQPIGIVRRVAGAYEAFLLEGGDVESGTAQQRNLLRLVVDGLHAGRRFQVTAGDVRKPRV